MPSSSICATGCPIAEEIVAERGVSVDHATLNRWVERYAALVAEDARRRKLPTDTSWRMDETYIGVKGQ